MEISHHHFGSKSQFRGGKQLRSVFHFIITDLKLSKSIQGDEMRLKIHIPNCRLFYTNETENSVYESTHT